MAALRIMIFFLIRALVWAGESCNNRNSEYGFALVDHVYKSFFADRLVSCYMSCTTQPACQSLNYNLADKTCEFNNDTKLFRPKYFVEKPTCVYAENPYSESPWRRLNSASVCFGAKDNKFGRFQFEFGGSLEAVRLVQLSGLVFWTNGKNTGTKWGCGGSSQQFIRVLVTDTSETILLPMGEVEKYLIPGYDSNSTEIVFDGFSNPLYLFSGQELRLWFTEDFYNRGEHDNAGKSCADVYAKYS